MIEPSKKNRTARATLRSRRQEIQQCLAQFRFVLGPERLLGRTRIASSEHPQSRKLREALESLGPVFSSFGLYMASRVDLLPENVCLELASITDQMEATPITIVQGLIAEEFAYSQDEVFSVFEEAPFESRLIFQSHHARLKNGQAVTVKVIHPELGEELELDMELLPLWKSVFNGVAQTNLPIEEAIADFRHTLQRQMNLLHEVKAFEELAQDAQEFDMLRVPIVYRTLCSSKVSTIELLPGLNLEDILPSLDKRGGGEYAPSSAASGNETLELDDLARRLCLVWLRQALLGSQFPAGLHSSNIRVLANKQITFTGGEFASLPSDAKKNLWNYLVANSTEDPDKACSCLLREMVQQGRLIDEDELQHRFREIVPFRDAGWHSNGDSGSFADYLFVQWNLASERGLRPQPHLLAFYRGLFQTVGLVRRLAPRRNSLLDGLQEVRTIEMFAQFREMMRLNQLSDNVDKYAAMLMALPQQLDHVLTLAAESNLRLKPQATRAAGDHRQKNSSAVVIALLLVIAAVVLMSHHLEASTAVGAWFDRISAIVLVVLGALLLRAASHL
jgi:predicted unusual protein kinase regulating ubiquinone biosynthesis (AarF/ABC1/UbiB family)